MKLRLSGEVWGEFDECKKREGEWEGDMCREGEVLVSMCEKVIVKG